MNLWTVGKAMIATFKQAGWRTMSEDSQEKGKEKQERQQAL
jgi:hypothetical protein